MLKDTQVETATGKRLNAGCAVTLEAPERDLGWLYGIQVGILWHTNDRGTY